MTNAEAVKRVRSYFPRLVVKGVSGVGGCYLMRRRVVKRVAWDTMGAGSSWELALTDALAGRLISCGQTERAGVNE
jgi:hypothetical protein